MSVITAYDFAEKSNGWAFGAAESAKALRELADRIDAGRVTVQKVNVTTIARGDEFTTTVMVMRFEERSA